MPQPQRSQVHVNRPLTNISIAYIQRAADFIADKVFPNVPVMKQSDKYFTYDKKFWFQTQAKKRGPGTESAGSGYTLNADTVYFADVWAVHKDVDDQTRANADMPLDMDRDATLYVTQQLMLRREKEFVRKYLATGVWTGYSAGGDYTPSPKWSASNSDPMADIDELKSSIKQQTGFLPNCLIVSNDVFFVLRNNPTVLDRIKYTQRGIITEELLAALFGVDKFLVASAVEDLDPEAVPEPGPNDMEFLFSNKFLLVYANPAPSILQPTAGYIFSWQGMFGAGAQGNRIKTFRMEQLESDRIEGEMAFDMKLVASDLGVLGVGVIS